MTLDLVAQAAIHVQETVITIIVGVNMTLPRVNATDLQVYDIGIPTFLLLYYIAVFGCFYTYLTKVYIFVQIQVVNEEDDKTAAAVDRKQLMNWMFTWVKVNSAICSFIAAMNSLILHSQPSGLYIASMVMSALGCLYHLVKGGVRIPANFSEQNSGGTQSGSAAAPVIVIVVLPLIFLMSLIGSSFSMTIGIICGLPFCIYNFRRNLNRLARFVCKDCTTISVKPEGPTDIIPPAGTV